MKRIINLLYSIGVEKIIPNFIKNKLKLLNNEKAVSARTMFIINKIADRNSLYPDKARKSRDERINDLIKWLRKYKYINDGYIEYGMDIVGFNKWNQYIDHYLARAEEFKNIPFYKLKGSFAFRPLNAVLSDDKFVFGTYLNAILPFSTPKIYKYFIGGVNLNKNNCFEGIEEGLKELADGKYVCKPTLGQCGRDIFLVEITDGNFKFNNGKNINDLKDALKKEPYIIQEFVVQHDAMKKLNASSVNTIRIVTTKFNSNVHLFVAVLRIGVTDSLMDNAAAGGTYVGIDSKTGKLLKYGYYHNRPMELKHPISNVVYEGYQIPFWNETVEMVKKLHLYFRKYPSIGWDVAITKNGPQIIENNYDWDFVMLQQVYGGLKDKWEAAKHLS